MRAPLRDRGEIASKIGDDRRDPPLPADIPLQ
jgi:hypothetical protein